MNMILAFCVIVFFVKIKAHLKLSKSRIVSEI